MNYPVAQTGNSWLSLVAETAGVSGATITRVELGSHDRLHGAKRAVVQLRDRRGQVIGAAYWYGDGSDLSAGVSVDLGCDLAAPAGSTLIAWIDEDALTISARSAAPSLSAVSRLFDRTTGMKLMLSGSHPTDSDEEFPEAA